MPNKSDTWFKGEDKVRPQDAWKYVVEKHPKKEALKAFLQSWINKYGENIPKSFEATPSEVKFLLNKIQEQGQEKGFFEEGPGHTRELGNWDWNFADAFFESENFHALVGEASRRGGEEHWTNFGTNAKQLSGELLENFDENLFEKNYLDKEGREFVHKKNYKHTKHKGSAAYPKRVILIAKALLAKHESTLAREVLSMLEKHANPLVNPDDEGKVYVDDAQDFFKALSKMEQPIVVTSPDGFTYRADVHKNPLLWKAQDGSKVKLEYVSDLANYVEWWHDAMSSGWKGITLYDITSVDPDKLLGLELLGSKTAYMPYEQNLNLMSLDEGLADIIREAIIDIAQGRSTVGEYLNMLMTLSRSNGRSKLSPEDQQTFVDKVTEGVANWKNRYEQADQEGRLGGSKMNVNKLAAELVRKGLVAEAKELLEIVVPVPGPTTDTTLPTDEFPPKDSDKPPVEKLPDSDGPPAVDGKWATIAAKLAPKGLHEEAMMLVIAKTPPGAKYERMVMDLKKKGVKNPWTIAWKQYNKEQGKKESQAGAPSNVAKLAAKLLDKGLVEEARELLAESTVFEFEDLPDDLSTYTWTKRWGSQQSGPIITDPQGKDLELNVTDVVNDWAKKRGLKVSE